MPDTRVEAGSRQRPGTGGSSIKAPRVTVAIPVFNGANYLQSAIASILGQTFQKFELIISDNASTDNTAAICQRYAAQDERIRYYRHPVNVGCNRNYNYLVGLARAPYFKWIAHDDLCASDYLERCVEVLDADPSVVVCHSRTGTINAEGSTIDEYSRGTATASHNARKRVFKLIAAPGGCFEQFGVIRTAALRATPLLGSYPAADSVLIIALALQGRIHELPAALYFVRDHPTRYTRAAITGDAARESGIALQSLDLRNAWFNPEGGSYVTFAQWRVARESVMVVLRSPAPWSTRLACCSDLVRRFWWHRSILVRDLVIGFAALYRRLTGPASAKA